MARRWYSWWKFCLDGDAKTPDRFYVVIIISTIWSTCFFACCCQPAASIVICVTATARAGASLSASSCPPKSGKQLGTPSQDWLLFKPQIVSKPREICDTKKLAIFPIEYPWARVSSFWRASFSTLWNYIYNSTPSWKAITVPFSAIPIHLSKIASKPEDLQSPIPHFLMDV